VFINREETEAAKFNKSTQGQAKVQISNGDGFNHVPDDITTVGELNQILLGMNCGYKLQKNWNWISAYRSQGNDVIIYRDHANVLGSTAISCGLWRLQRQMDPQANPSKIFPQEEWYWDFILTNLWRWIYTSFRTWQLSYNLKQ